MMEWVSIAFGNAKYKMAEDGNSLQDKQWTRTGAGPVVPDEEDEEYSKDDRLWRRQNTIQ